MEVDPLIQLPSIKTEPEDCEDTPLHCIVSQHQDQDTYTSLQCATSQYCKIEHEDPEQVYIDRIDLLRSCNVETKEEDEFSPPYITSVSVSPPELQFLNYPGTVTELSRPLTLNKVQNKVKSETLAPCETRTAISSFAVDIKPQICNTINANNNNPTIVPCDQHNYPTGLISLAPITALINPSAVIRSPLTNTHSSTTELSSDILKSPLTNTHTWNTTELSSDIVRPPLTNTHTWNTTEFPVVCKRDPVFEQQTDPLFSPNVEKLHLNSQCSQVLLSTDNAPCVHDVPRSYLSDANISYTRDVIETVSKEQGMSAPAIKVKEEIVNTEMTAPKINLTHCYVQLTRLTVKDIAKWTIGDEIKNERKYNEKDATLKKQPKVWYHIPPCKKCGEKFKNHTLLNKHREVEHGDQVLFCYICFTYFKTRNEWKLHIKFYHVKSITCDLCSRLFKTVNTLKHHIKIYHQTTISKVCKIVKEENIQKFNLISKYECKRCCRDFLSQFTLNRHIKMYEGDDCKNECDICSLKFRNKYHLARHKTTHSNKRPFPCDKCNKRFKTNYKLKFHYQVHKTDNICYKCDNCNKSFKIKQYLKQHVKNIC